VAEQKGGYTAQFVTYARPNQEREFPTKSHRCFDPASAAQSHEENQADSGQLRMHVTSRIKHSCLESVHFLASRSQSSRQVAVPNPPKPLMAPPNPSLKESSRERLSLIAEDPEVVAFARGASMPWRARLSFAGSFLADRTTLRRF